MVQSNHDSTLISSSVVGQISDKMFQAEYRIETDLKWRTMAVIINSLVNGEARHLHLESDRRCNWQATGNVLENIKGCIDVDISVTPFTNTLPINRLELKVGEKSDIQVVYINVIEDEVTTMKQRYYRVSKRVYHYENMPNDFEADIEIDELGFVVAYQPLFYRKNIIHLS